ncbi:hypothetical protein HCAG_08636 [Histoplasma mississippiense (nom. inval.)]|uniref:hypothetical protein n=1 Tax=Ajellomyces capsulatus (strain NAm1 / WU24) TaxID=2059318 RepID=UPI000157D20D|nr:hypothetical protein HCAG_08636 [Histoplasma mississippiense (nom. inval.)]EDN04982.1 hypothetical protein HCAG_08636 [Histoplasma mississippiense (nom. inval.)]
MTASDPVSQVGAQEEPTRSRSRHKSYPRFIPRFQASLLDRLPFSAESDVLRSSSLASESRPMGGEDRNPKHNGHRKSFSSQPSQSPQSPQSPPITPTTPIAPVQGEVEKKVLLLESDCYDKLGFSFPRWKKWTILSVVFFVQLSMNFNTSIYSNAITPLALHFSISEQAARVGQMIFLVAYAFGSELWAPWSEELGRYPVMQLSLSLVNLWQIPCALARNYHTIVIGRFFGGLSSAGGSVTLGMIADMWEPDDQQFAVAFIVLSSVAGSVIAPIVGGFMEFYLDWRWNFWGQLIFGAAAQLAHLLFVPETRTTILLDREAKRQRRAGETNIYGPSEIDGMGITMRDVAIIWARPFSLFGFAWTSLGPPQVHWIAPMLFSLLIAVANYCIYMATIDYMVASYGPYSASATGGNALARDFLAGIAAMYSTPLYESIGNKYQLEWPSTILAIVSFIVTVPIYVFYWKGPIIREKSKFAKTLATDRKARNIRQMGEKNRSNMGQTSESQLSQSSGLIYGVNSKHGIH